MVALKQALTGVEEESVKSLSKEYLGRRQWRLLYEAQDLHDISTIFWKTGQHISTS
jgi:hypothetical protein